MPSPTTTVVAIREARRALDHAHAEAGEALLGIVRRDRRDDAVDVLVDLGEIDVGTRRVDAEGSAARDARAARLAAAISAFDGTQPVLRHSPPILPFSISTTGTPNAAAAAATDSPPEPAPMTQMSGVRVLGHVLVQVVLQGARHARDAWRVSRSIACTPAQIASTTTGTSASTPSATSAASSCGVSTATEVEIEPAIGAPAARQAR